MTTTKTKKTQCQRLLSYLRKNRKGITTMEAFQYLGICRLSERIRELEGETADFPEATYAVLQKAGYQGFLKITRTRELASNGATVTRYKLAR
jgi:hypothetical protein